MCAAPRLHHVGVAKKYVYGFDRDANEIGNHLREAGFVALARRLGTDHNLDAIVRTHLDSGLFFRRSDRGLDIVCEAEPQELAALFRLAFARLEAVPVGKT